MMGNLLLMQQYLQERAKDKENFNLLSLILIPSLIIMYNFDPGVKRLYLYISYSKKHAD